MRAESGLDLILGDVNGVAGGGKFLSETQYKEPFPWEVSAVTLIAFLEGKASSTVKL